MEKIFGFDELKTGQSVKVKGMSGSNGTFQAHEIKIKPSIEQAVMEGKLSGIDVAEKAIQLMNQTIRLKDGVEIRNTQRQSIQLQDLKVGDIVKLKGSYSADEGFVPVRVKMQDSSGFDLDELQGSIQNIDAANKTIQVNGFTVVINGDTEIEGFDRF